MEMTFGQKLRTARKAAKLTLEQLAAEMGVSYPAVQQWETDKTFPSTENLLKLRSLLGVDVESPPQPNAGQRLPLTSEPPRGGARDLAVRGSAVGGQEGDFRFNGEILQYIPRPPGLIGRKKAYAVILQNDSMFPAYRPGWPIYVDEDGPRPVAGDEVLLELYPEEDGEPGAAFVKTLVSRSGGKVIVSQFNPPKDIPFDADRIKQILRVIPYPEIMGV